MDGAPLEIAKHHESVHVAQGRVQERTWKATDGFEAELVPEMHCALVGADDEVELHGAKPERSGVLKRVGAHGLGHSAPSG